LALVSKKWYANVMLQLIYKNTSAQCTSFSLVVADPQYPLR